MTTWHLQGFSKEDELIRLDLPVPGVRSAEVARLLSEEDDERLYGSYEVGGDALRALARAAGHEVRDDLDYFVTLVA